MGVKTSVRNLTTTVLSHLSLVKAWRQLAIAITAAVAAARRLLPGTSCRSVTPSLAEGFFQAIKESLHSAGCLLGECYLSRMSHFCELPCKQYSIQPQSAYGFGWFFSLFARQLRVVLVEKSFEILR